MNTEKHAAENLLNRGVSWPLPSPWYLRMLGIKNLKVTVRALKLGALLEVSLLYLKAGIKKEDLDKNPSEEVKKFLRPVCKMTAICILNSYWKIKLFRNILARFILWHFTANMQLEAALFIASFSGYTSFLNTIVLFGDLKVTTPKDPSPEDQGSQQK
jgi:hypothetical protein